MIYFYTEIRKAITNYCPTEKAQLNGEQHQLFMINRKTWHKGKIFKS